MFSYDFNLTRSQKIYSISIGLLSLGALYVTFINDSPKTLDQKLFAEKLEFKETSDSQKAERAAFHQRTRDLKPADFNHAQTPQEMVHQAKEAIKTVTSESSQKRKKRQCSY